MIDDMLLSRLPFAESQTAFEGASIASIVRCTLDWHGTTTADERGAVAIVQSGGVLADFVGERVRLRYINEPSTTRSVIVYVYDEGQLGSDISIPRPLYSRLANLAVTPITVAAEVVDD